MMLPKCLIKPITIALFIAFSFAYDEEKYQDLPLGSIHDACQPSLLGLQEYTGFRIQHQISLDYPFDHHTRITRCVRNEVNGWDSYFPMNRNQDIKWGHRFCTSHHNHDGACYILARRKVAAQRNSALFYHGDWVGGIFRCPGNLDDNHIPCTNENAMPLFPLYADEPFFEWEDLPDLRHLIRRVPLLVTLTEGGVPHADIYRKAPYNWWTYIDIHESYTFDNDERNMLRLALDFMANGYYFLTNSYVGLFFVPLTEDYYAEFGDGRPRRNTYMTADRHPFEAENWTKEPPFFRRHNFETERLVAVIDDDDIEISSFMSSNSLSISTSQILKTYGFIPKDVLNDYKKNLTVKFEEAIRHEDPMFSHPPPPTNIDEFLDNSY
ncbi:uncharacterized protein SAPINGB_P005579 [Magnusiomyces paraingens]|uniref:Uncharacterized protein n=1 Tax=Magnusiomyces paraingens TaxID=2606893 RepID=A0A5E8C2H0_9ASCO|nr:uncharacterized protein SAPINGB_P005579 [Saprochaete ingens]VVT57190.1 unnamed protein product [Saprochaete ingens]